MVIKKCMKLMTGALLLSLTAGTFGAINANFEEQFKAMQAELAQLRADSDANWLNERRVEQVKDIVREVLADADTRASLLESGMTAGHNGKHFFLASEDGRFLLNIGGQIQFRYIMNQRKGVSRNGHDNGESGFTLRRTKLKFKGHINSPKIGYAIGIQTDRTNETIYLDHAYVKYKLRDDLVLWAGERKSPFLREELTSSSRQLTVERSQMNEIFTLGRTQGVGAVWTANENLIAHVAITDGSRSGEPSSKAKKDFDDDTTDFAITGRVDLRLLGDWKQKKNLPPGAVKTLPCSSVLLLTMKWAKPETTKEVPPTTASLLGPWMVLQPANRVEPFMLLSSANISMLQAQSLPIWITMAFWFKAATTSSLTNSSRLLAMNSFPWMVWQQKM